MSPHTSGCTRAVTGWRRSICCRTASANFQFTDVQQYPSCIWPSLWDLFWSMVLGCIQLVGAWSRPARRDLARWQICLDKDGRHLPKYCVKLQAKVNMLYIYYDGQTSVCKPFISTVKTKASDGLCFICVHQFLPVLLRTLPHMQHVREMLVARPNNIHGPPTEVHTSLPTLVSFNPIHRCQWVRVIVFHAATFNERAKTKPNRWMATLRRY